MLLSRIEFDPSRASARDFHLLSSAGGAHKLVWQWFAGDAGQSRDFLFRVEPGTPRIWTLSENEPRTGGGAWRSETKEFAPQLRPGDRLQFLVTVNPTLRAKSGPAAGKRHDVVMHEKVRLRANGQHTTEADIAERAGTAWMTKRGEQMGCRFDEASLRAERYRVERFSRPKSARASIAMLDLSGAVIVEEPDLFVEILSRGVGPGKAFGCGLMLIKRM